MRFQRTPVTDETAQGFRWRKVCNVSSSCSSETALLGGACKMQWIREKPSRRIPRCRQHRPDRTSTARRVHFTSQSSQRLAYGVRRLMAKLVKFLMWPMFISQTLTLTKREKSTSSSNESLHRREQYHAQHGCRCRSRKECRYQTLECSDWGLGGLGLGDIRVQRPHQKPQGARVTSSNRLQVGRSVDVQCTMANVVRCGGSQRHL